MMNTATEQGNLLKSAARMDQKIKELVHVPGAITLGKYWAAVQGDSVVAIALIPTVNGEIYGHDMFSKYSDLVKDLFKEYGEVVKGELKKLEDGDFYLYAINAEEQCKFDLKSFDAEGWGKFWATTNKGIINSFISFPRLQHIKDPINRKALFDKFRNNSRFILSHLGYVITGDIKVNESNKRVFQQRHAVFEHANGVVEHDKVVTYRMPGYLSL